MIRMIVFDMAGTVVNEDNVVYKTLQKSINEAGHSFTLDQVLAIGAGKEKLQAIKDILQLSSKERDDEFVNSIYKTFITLLATAYERMEIKAQPGAEELFVKLKEKGIYVVINTGYDLKTAESIMKKVGWEEGNQVDALVTASHVAHNRPNPDMIEFAKKKFSLANSLEIIKVGDSAIDIEEGRNAGCAVTIGITTGAQTREQMQLANPDYVIDSLMEILPLLA